MSLFSVLIKYVHLVIFLVVDINISINRVEILDSVARYIRPFIGYA